MVGIDDEDKPTVASDDPELGLTVGDDIVNESTSQSQNYGLFPRSMRKKSSRDGSESGSEWEEDIDEFENVKVVRSDKWFEAVHSSDSKRRLPQRSKSYC